MINFPSRSLTLLTPNRIERKTLICFPYAGGGASVFRNWRQSIEARQANLISVQYPGREVRFNEPFAVSHHELARTIATEIIEQDYDFEQTALFGHSFGAAIAFEVTRELERQGKKPSILIVSGRPSPSLDLARPSVATLTDDQFLDRIVQFKGFPAELLENSEFMEIVLPILRADFKLSEDFDRENKKPTNPIASRLMAFGAENDPWLNHTALDGWTNYTTAAFSTRWFLGGHFYINDTIDPILQCIFETSD